MDSIVVTGNGPLKGEIPIAGAKNAWKFKMVARTKAAGVIEEEWRVLEHENGRVYEIQLTTYGGAAREFRKDIRAFWKKLKISSK